MTKINEPERSEAKANWNFSRASKYDITGIENSIFVGFTWNDTVQGSNYWVKIHSKLLNGEYKFKNKQSVMTREKQEAHFEDFVQKQREVLLRKGNDYSSIDRLSNLKLAGSICQLTPEQNCLSLIATKVARLGVLLQGKVPNNESTQDSVLDLANYAVLLYMILSDKQVNESVQDNSGVVLSIKAGLGSL